MFCQFCGSQIDDNSTVCPVCNRQLSSSLNNGAKEPVQAEKDENPKGKGYAAVVSALMAFPTLLALVGDYLGPPEWLMKLFHNPSWAQPGVITWSAYLLGIVMCLWMMIVLPALKPKRPSVAVCVCLGVISLYLVFLAYINKSAEWYVDYVMPICLMLTVTSAITSILVAYKIIPRSHITSALIVQAALLCIGIEILFDMNLRHELNLRWSIMASVSAISAVGIYEAIGYASRINKK